MPPGAGMVPVVTVVRHRQRGSRGVFGARRYGAAAVALTASCGFLLVLGMELLAFVEPTAVLADTAAAVGGDGGRSLLQSSTPLATSYGSDCCTRLMAGAIGFSSGLPLLLIDTGGAKVTSKDTPIRATICSCSPAGGSWDGQPYQDFYAEALIKLRGSSSVQNKKKSYNVKFRARSPNGGTTKLMVPMLGMPADDEWALYGPETDKTLGMRNVLAYDIFRRMGRWAPRTRYCEVFLLDDGSGTPTASKYEGLFIATERITIGPDRVNVRRMDPDKDLSGGYIFGFENDNIESDDLSFRPATTLLNFVMHAPTFEDQALQGGPHPTPREQAALKWITAYVSQMEGALLANFPQASAIRAKAGLLSSQGLTAGFPYGPNGPTTAAPIGGPGGPPPAGQGGWREFVEVDSFIDYFLATELYKNPDGYRGSVYFSKNVGSPVSFGPPWDYNEAFGVCCGYPIEGFNSNGVSSGSSGGSAISTEGWRFNICDQPARCKADPVDGISQYYRSTWRDSVQRMATGQRWQQLRGAALSDAVLTSMVDAQANLIRDAASRDYDRWASIRDSPYFTSHQQQFEYEVSQLRSWLVARAKWMDSALADAASGGWGGGSSVGRSAGQAAQPPQRQWPTAAAAFSAPRQQWPSATSSSSSAAAATAAAAAAPLQQWSTAPLASWYGYSNGGGGGGGFGSATAAAPQTAPRPFRGRFMNFLRSSGSGSGNGGR